MKLIKKFVMGTMVLLAVQSMTTPMKAMAAGTNGTSSEAVREEESIPDVPLEDEGEPDHTTEEKEPEDKTAADETEVDKILEDGEIDTDVRIEIRYGIFSGITIKDARTDANGYLYLIYKEGKKYFGEVVFDGRYTDVTMYVNGDPVLELVEPKKGKKYSFSFSFDEAPTEISIEATGELKNAEAEKVETEKTEAADENLILFLERMQHLEDEISVLKDDTEKILMLLEDLQLRSDEDGWQILEWKTDKGNTIKAEAGSNADDPHQAADGEINGKDAELLKMLEAYAQMYDSLRLQSDSLNTRLDALPQQFLELMEKKEAGEEYSVVPDEEAQDNGMIADGEEVSMTNAGTSSEEIEEPETPKKRPQIPWIPMTCILGAAYVAGQGVKGILSRRKRID